MDAIAGLDGVHLAFLGDPEPGYGHELTAQVEARGVVVDGVEAPLRVPRLCGDPASMQRLAAIREQMSLLADYL